MHSYDIHKDNIWVLCWHKYWNVVIDCNHVDKKCTLLTTETCNDVILHVMLL